ncbi:HNH homing endonuclease [Acinetobacter phage vB_AbaP_APK2]|uniref:HNH homing endonuclease n=3 Tax=Friunavirus IME200 TaxID=1985713 RepID=A0A5H2V0G9_9CAUD|nr:HNH homing endonuclease [Acinetobacter phage vB_AbaP_APK2]AZU99271.1 HNH homing endonuclease [Acinetobacter phage vB_AbaP_APK2-2]AZU99321.1 HNH homing endonuclease [Acinetobacter phage vB_AbaP_APK93]
MLSDELKLKFKYDPDTGVITRLERMGNYAANTPCVGKFVSGYIKIRYKGIIYSGHRLAWFLYYGEEPPKYIDHINQDKADNRISNLRATTTSQNQMNIKVHERSTTGIKGIMPVRGGKLFRAEVCLNGKRYQKHSKDIEVLKRWVVAKREELHKEFASH